MVVWSSASVRPPASLLCGFVAWQQQQQQHRGKAQRKHRGVKRYSERKETRGLICLLIHSFIPCCYSWHRFRYFPSIYEVSSSWSVNWDKEIQSWILKMVGQVLRQKGAMDWQWDWLQKRKKAVFIKRKWRQQQSVRDSELDCEEKEGKGMRGEGICGKIIREEEE